MPKTYNIKQKNKVIIAVVNPVAEYCKKLNKGPRQVTLNPMYDSDTVTNPVANYRKSRRGVPGKPL